MLDTNVVSEAMRPKHMRNENVTQWLLKNDGEGFCISSITEAELWLGIKILPPGQRREILELTLRSTLVEVFDWRILPFESRAAFAYGNIFATRRGIGRPISHEDCAIAATAHVHQLSLATRNLTDFENCGIELFDPWKT